MHHQLLPAKNLYAKKIIPTIFEKNLLYLNLLPVIALMSYFDLNQIITTREINAAVINISGRQRMLSQRTAMFALRLVCTQNSLEQEKLRQQIQQAIALMEKSHEALINGDPDMKLPGQPSETVQKIYFDAPYYLDLQISEYIVHARFLAQASSAELTQENFHLQAILRASEQELLEAIEVLVSQYQEESDAAQYNTEKQQVQLYHQSCTATTAAQAYAKKLEQTLEELKYTQSQLIQSEKLSAIGQMVAGIAHEINNPVNFIYGNFHYASDYIQDLLGLLNLYQQNYPNPVEVIQDKIETIDLDFLQEDLPKVLKSMQVGADRIRQIVLSLRNFSRTDQVVRQSMDLHEGIDSTLLLLQHRLKASCNYPAIEIVKDYGQIPKIDCFAGQLNQVFMNLLSNAIDALEEVSNRNRCITIRTRVNADKSSVLIQIADNGLGMNKNVLAKLFEPFFTTKPPGKGTGLGLSISHQIVVEKHGGILKCDSVLGQGTEFSIELPLERDRRLGTGEMGKLGEEIANYQLPLPSSL
jgi:two-component system NtrC family sensor kinase